MGYLTTTQQNKLDHLRRSDAFTDAVLSHTERVLGSKAFGSCQNRARDLLQYLVQMKLIDEPRVTERGIRSLLFPDRTGDGTVRQAARVIRDRLANYYQWEGRRDPLRLSIPFNGYQPEIRDRRLAILVGRFDDWSLLRDQGDLCQILSKEIWRRLDQFAHFDVRCVNAWPRDRTSFHGAIRGAFLCSDDDIRLCFGILPKAGGRPMLGTLEGRREDLFKMAGAIASMVAQHFTRQALPRVGRQTPPRMKPKRAEYKEQKLLPTAEVSPTSD